MGKFGIEETHEISGDVHLDEMVVYPEWLRPPFLDDLARQ